MTVGLLDRPEYDLWDKFIISSAGGSFYNLSGWIKALCDTYGFKYYYIVKRISGEIKAGLPVIETDSIFYGRKLSNNLFSLYGSFIYNTPEDFKEIIEFLIHLGESRNCKAIELRTYNSLPVDCLTNQNIIESKIRVIPLLEFEDSYEKTVEKLKIKFRKNLKYICAKIETDKKFFCCTEGKHQDYMDFYSMLIKHCKNKHHMFTAPLEFFLNLKKNFGQDSLKLYLLKYGNKTVAGIVVLLFKQKAYYGWSASDMEFDKFSVSTYLLDYIIKDLHSLKVKLFDFGVTSPDNQNLLFFKTKWGSEIKQPFFYLIPLKKIKYKNHSAETSYIALRKIIRYVPQPVFNRLNNMLFKNFA